METPKGSAMGTRMAPSYANLFMGKFEQTFIMAGNPFVSIVKLYIDDIFFLWQGTEEEAKHLMEYINDNSWGITFTPEIEFLDLKIFYKIATQRQLFSRKSTPTVI